MSYIENNLTTGENLIYRAKLHWIVFFRSAFWFFIGYILAKNSTEPGSASAAFGGLLILGSIAMFISAIIRFKTSEFGVTNKRIIVKEGFISRKSLEVLLQKVEGIQVDQSVIGRILGYGAITVSGTGGSKDPFKSISNPLEFRKKAQEQISSVQDKK